MPAYGLAHLSFALAIVYIMRLPPATALFASQVPDIDAMFSFGFPLTHRGVMHSIAAAFLLATVAYAIVGRQESGPAFLVGYQSHLLLDTLTPSGVMWFYPLERYISLKLALAASLSVNTAVVVLSLTVVAGWMKRSRIVRLLKRNVLPW